MRARLHPRPLATLLLVAALLLGLAACGGGGGSGGDEPDPPTAQEQVRAVALRIATSDDLEAICRRDVTRRFVAEVYGTLERCIAAGEDAETSRAQVREVTVDGSRATAAIVNAPRDGVDGASGEVELVRDGGAWRLDRFGDDYLRALLVADIARSREGLGAHDGLRRCIGRQVAAAPDPRVRRLAVYAMRRDERLRASLLGLAERCRVELADFVAAEIVRGIGRGRGAAFARCARRELRGLLVVTGLASKTLRGNTDSAGTAALQGLALGVNRSCSGR